MTEQLLTKNIATMKAEVAAHIAADAVRAEHYWKKCENAVGGTGCFIGCLTHGEDAREVSERFGIPLPLVRIAESIFEALPEGKRANFFEAIPYAIGSDGKDLSRVTWKFLASELRALPEQPSSIQAVIDPVIAGMDLLSSGNDWPEAADASARAADASARAADAAYAAADAYAYTCAYAAAARAAYVAAVAARDPAYCTYAARGTDHCADCDDCTDARIRQRDTLLRLISEA